MAEESQNALLKTLEEPPGYAHLLLITSEPGALLETVRSRCQRSASRRCRWRRSSAAWPPSCRARRRRSCGAGGAGGRRPRPGALPRLPLGPAAARPRRGLRARGLPRRARLAALGGPARGRRRAGQDRGGPGRRGRRRAGRGARQGPRRRPDPPRGRRGREARRAPRPDRGDRPGARAGRDLVHRPRRGRRGGAGAGPQRRPRRGARGRRARRRSGRLPARGRARDGDPAPPQVNVNEELALDALFHRAAGCLANGAPVV